MKLFAQLYLQLDQTTRTSEKVDALVRYFRAAPPLDAAWAVFVLSGRKIGKSISSRLLRQWAAEVSGHPLWLVEQCYHLVGDLSETLSLLVLGNADEVVPPLHEIIERRIKVLPGLTQASQRQVIVATWSQLDAGQRLVFQKLLSGNFRVGVSKQLLIRALAEAAGVQEAVIAHRLAGDWKPDENALGRLLCAHDPSAGADPGVPYPFMLANAFHGELSALGPESNWLAEWKWDGIRAQVIRRAGRTMLWSRGNEGVTAAFPEIVQASAALPEGTVLDGEIVAWDDAAQLPLPFTRLQRRLNRRIVEPTFWPETPVTFIAFDLLEHAGCDVRGRTLDERRNLLASIFDVLSPSPVLRLSTTVGIERWEDAGKIISDSRRRGVEGIMLKRRDSSYQPGRPAGLWWKLKVDALTMDAVLIAAESGRGRRAGLLTDYTFAVWDEKVLVPITKAFSGLSDDEIVEVDRFARRHTIARHGPVHSVEPLLVFEIGFEAIQRSLRHKSGLAIRFPRILRMRKDKSARQADRLHELRALLQKLDSERGGTIQGDVPQVTP